MNRIYISDHGDDKNDGRTRETAIYSCTRETAIYSSKRAIKHCAEAHLMQGDATLQRLAQEIERRKKSRRPKPTPLELPASKLVIRRT